MVDWADMVSSDSAITECSNTDMAVRLVGWSCSMYVGFSFTFGPSKCTALTHFSRAVRQT